MKICCIRFHQEYIFSGLYVILMDTFVTNCKERKITFYCNYMYAHIASSKYIDRWDSYKNKQYTTYKMIYQIKGRVKKF